MPWSKRRKKFNRMYDAEKHRKWLWMKWMKYYLGIRLAVAFDHAILYGIDPPADAPKPEYPPVPDIILRLSGITREEWDRKKEL